MVLSSEELDEYEKNITVKDNAFLHCLKHCCLILLIYFCCCAVIASHHHDPTNSRLSPDADPLILMGQASGR